MKIRIAGATIVDKRHPDNGKTRDILISNGVITKIAEKIEEPADKIIEVPGLCVSIGWMDMRANFRDPGNEEKEDLQSGLRAAARGGFTAIALSPDTSPPVDGKGAVEYILNRSREGAVEVFPIGALSKGLKGESLAEMYDMQTAGAVAFGDDKKSIASSGLLQRALLYASNVQATILHFPYDKTLVLNGQMHEGIQSTTLGLKGIPSIAEEMVVQRDLSLLAHSGGNLHIGPLSAAPSVELVKSARGAGLKVSCETTAAHLAYADSALHSFDTNHKLMPPLRHENNRKRLIALLSEGHIQVISSDHSPEDEEHKKVEFDYAAFGAAGIEVFFPLVYEACGDALPLHELVATFSIHPRSILGLDVPEIETGQIANITLFTTREQTHVVRNLMQTKAYNVAEIGREMKGRVVAVINQGVLAESNP